MKKIKGNVHIKNEFDSIYIMKKMIPKIFETCPVAFSFKIILEIFHGLSFAVITILLQWFFDAAAKLVTKDITFLSAIFSLLVLCIGYIASQVLNGVTNYIPKVINEKVKGNLSGQIHEKLSKISPILFEDTKKLDFINKAEEGKNNIVIFVDQFLGIFIFYLPYFIFMAWYLFHLKQILVIALFFVFAPTFITQLVRAKVFTKVEDQSASIRRESDYYEDCNVGREYYKETRILGGFAYFKKLYVNSLAALQKIRYMASFRTGLIELGVSFITVLGYIGILLLLFAALMKKEISVTEFSAVFASLTILYSMMDELFCEQIAEMSQNFGTIRNYLEFLKLNELEGKAIDIKKNHDIILDNVSFSYPGIENEAIKNVSLHIKSGETLAIVGENGSGKSTLIRLITGLYRPKAGKVTYDNIDISNVALSSLFENTSAIFQKYQRYQMTLVDNIRISQIELSASEKKLNLICRTAGVSKDSDAYPNGYDTMLSREFDGVDISGGQWQRVAIARGFFRKHQMIILDEPTAAIDPYEETRIYNQFAEISKDKTSIIVTHRLGSVKLADRIAVMKEGEIVQVGTHEELIIQEGEYTRLYEAQEKWYRENYFYELPVCLGAETHILLPSHIL